MFQPVFFIVVEVPSMIVITIHKLLMTAKGRPFILLPIWAYRCIGVFELTLLLPIALAPLASDAGYLLWILLVAIVIFVVVVRRRSSASVNSPHTNRPQAVAPHLGAVRDQARQAITQTVQNRPGVLLDPNTAAQAAIQRPRSSSMRSRVTTE